MIVKETKVIHYIFDDYNELHEEMLKECGFNKYYISRQSDIEKVIENPAAKPIVCCINDKPTPQQYTCMIVYELKS